MFDFLLPSRKSDFNCLVDLPNDILFLSFSFLEAADMSAVSVACRAFSKVVGETVVALFSQHYGAVHPPAMTRTLLFHLVEAARLRYPSDNTSVLLWAARYGYPQIVRQIATLDPTAVNSKRASDGATPLYLACSQGHNMVIRTLLRYGADVNRCTVLGNTPLHTAAANGHMTALRLLLRARASRAALNKEGQSALMRASAYGHIPALRLLATVKRPPASPPPVFRPPPPGGQASEQCPPPITLPSFDDFATRTCVPTPVLEAREQPLVPVAASADSRVGSFGVGSVSWLVGTRHGFRPAPAAPAPPSPLPPRPPANASRRREDSDGREEGSRGDGDGDGDEGGGGGDGGGEGVVGSEEGGDSNGTAFEDEDSVGISVHHATATNGHRGGLAPLHLAAEGGHVEMVQYLLEHDCDGNVATAAGVTPLVAATERGHQAVVTALLAHAVNVNARCANGKTALFCACEQGDAAMAALLMEAGADHRVATARNKTPLYTAAEQSHVDIVVLLLERCVKEDLFVQTTYGTNPMFIASKQRSQAVRILLAQFARRQDKLARQSVVPQLFGHNTPEGAFRESHPPGYIRADVARAAAAAADVAASGEGDQSRAGRRRPSSAAATGRRPLSARSSGSSSHRSVTARGRPSTAGGGRSGSDGESGSDETESSTDPAGRTAAELRAMVVRARKRAQERRDQLDRRRRELHATEEERRQRARRSARKWKRKIKKLVKGRKSSNTAHSGGGRRGSGSANGSAPRPDRAHDGREFESRSGWASDSDVDDNQRGGGSGYRHRRAGRGKRGQRSSTGTRAGGEVEDRAAIALSNRKRATTADAEAGSSRKQAAPAVTLVASTSSRSHLRVRPATASGGSSSSHTATVRALRAAANDGWRGHKRRQPRNRTRDAPPHEECKQEDHAFRGTPTGEEGSGTALVVGTARVPSGSSSGSDSGGESDSDGSTASATISPDIGSGPPPPRFGSRKWEQQRGVTEQKGADSSSSEGDNGITTAESTMEYSPCSPLAPPLSAPSPAPPLDLAHILRQRELSQSQHQHPRQHHPQLHHQQLAEEGKGALAPSPPLHPPAAARHIPATLPSPPVSYRLSYQRKALQGTVNAADGCHQGGDTVASAAAVSPLSPLSLCSSSRLSIPPSPSPASASQGGDADLPAFLSRPHSPQLPASVASPLSTRGSESAGSSGNGSGSGSSMSDTQASHQPQRVTTSPLLSPSRTTGPSPPPLALARTTASTPSPAGGQLLSEAIFAMGVITGPAATVAALPASSGMSLLASGGAWDAEQSLPRAPGSNRVNRSPPTSEFLAISAHALTALPAPTSGQPTHSGAPASVALGPPRPLPRTHSPRQSSSPSPSSARIVPTAVSFDSDFQIPTAVRPTTRQGGRKRQQSYQRQQRQQGQPRQKASSSQYHIETPSTIPQSDPLAAAADALPLPATAHTGMPALRARPLTQPSTSTPRVRASPAAAAAIPSASVAFVNPLSGVVGGRAFAAADGVTRAPPAAPCTVVSATQSSEAENRTSNGQADARVVDGRDADSMPSSAAAINTVFSAAATPFARPRTTGRAVASTQRRQGARPNSGVRQRRSSSLRSRDASSNTHQAPSLSYEQVQRQQQRTSQQKPQPKQTPQGGRVRASSRHGIMSSIAAGGTIILRGKIGRARSIRHTAPTGAVLLGGPVRPQRAQRGPRVSRAAGGGVISR